MNIKRYEERKKKREHTHINNERHVEKCVMNSMKEKEKNRETLKSLIVSSSLARIDRKSVV